MVGLLITPHLHVLYHRYIIILRLHSLLLMCRTISTPSRPGMLSPDPLIILHFRMTLFALLFKPFLKGVPRRDVSLWIWVFLTAPQLMTAYHRILTWASLSSCGYPGLIGSSTSFLKKAVTVLFSRKTYDQRTNSSLLIPRTTIYLVSLFRENFTLTLVVPSVYVPQLWFANARWRRLFTSLPSKVSRQTFILMTFTVQNIHLLLPRLSRDSVNCFFNSAWTLHLKRIRRLRPLWFVLAFSSHCSCLLFYTNRGIPNFYFWTLNLRLKESKGLPQEKL